MRTNSDMVVFIDWIINEIDQSSLPLGKSLNVAKLVHILVANTLGDRQTQSPTDLFEHLRIPTKVKASLFWRIQKIVDDIVYDIPPVNHSTYYTVELVESADTYLKIVNHHMRNTLDSFTRFLRIEENEGRYIDTVPVSKLLREYKAG